MTIIILNTAVVHNGTRALQNQNMEKLLGLKNLMIKLNEKIISDKTLFIKMILKKKKLNTNSTEFRFFFFNFSIHETRFKRPTIIKGKVIGYHITTRSHFKHNNTKFVIPIKTTKSNNS